MSKHTKGPWVLGSDRTQVLQRDKGPFRLIASTFSPDCIDGTGDHSLDGPTMYANARLISAAPELLRELKSAIFYIETYGGEVTSNFSAGGNLDAVKAIIAKAEGNEK